MNDDFEFPPPPFPLVITNQSDKKGTIKVVIEDILSNKRLHTLLVVAPYISSYFVQMLSKTPVKYVVVVINKDDLNPDYVDEAIELLKAAPFKVIVRQRPKNSQFVHMKVMMPCWKIEVPTQTIDGLVNGGEIRIEPTCVIAGSVNFTKNGISISDEMLIVLRDPHSIKKVKKAFDGLLDGATVKFDSTKSGRKRASGS